MKTVLVTTCWLDDPIYLAKTQKWLRHYIYNNHLKYDDIILLDNASSFSNIIKINYRWSGTILVQRFPVHMKRDSHLEYPYLWRGVYFFQELFKEYDRIIYTDNDAYLLSPKVMEYVNNFESGWESFWCTKHGFPETGIQIVTKDSKEYNAFVNGTLEDFIYINNGKTMETRLPVSVNKDFIGDRHSESGIIIQDSKWDFSCQVPLEMEMKYNEV